jgi:hypothetical protein
LGVQVFITALILALVPGNITKLAAMVTLWAISFAPFKRSELVMMLCVNALFVVMNAGALQKGVFRFLHPDVLGMPIYEFFMWGFYTLHALRFVGGSAPKGRIWTVVLMAAAFATPFSTIAEAHALTIVSASILLLCCVLYHEPLDFAYIGYMLLIGTLIEYVGVWSGQWNYPGSPAGGVPLWYLTMWGGVGLFTRRLLLPLVYRQHAQIRTA